MNPCGGFVLLLKHKDILYTVLVKTPGGRYGFPKGKFDKKKDKKHIDTAWRELKEETGIDEKQIEMLPDVSIDELNDRGNVSVRYYVGRFVDEEKIDPTQFKFNFDQAELSSAEFVALSKALKLKDFVFYDRRKEVLKTALVHFCE
jgi:8-oxo-dGTP pyrophosphatase MutT (NUDIX family)